jgi:hypothetical protein
MTTTKRDLAVLSEKRVLAYFKKPVGTSVSVVRTESDYLLTDKNLLVRVPASTNLGTLAFDEGWQQATWPSLKEPAVEAGPDLESKWKEWEAAPALFEPELTHQFLEIPVAGHHHPGLLYRKFVAVGRGPWYYDKRFLDLFSPDVMDLEDFLFEHLDRVTPDGLMRVSARYGPVAYLMPMRLK